MNDSLWSPQVVVIALVVLGIVGCNAQQQQQAQTAVTLACAIEGAAAPVAISVAPKQAEDITKADAAARAACAAMRGVVVTTAAP